MIFAEKYLRFERVWGERETQRRKREKEKRENELK